MDKLIIIGAGGHSAEIDDYISLSYQLGNPKFLISGYLDDNSSNYSLYKFSAPYLGTIKDHKVITDGSIKYLMGIANLKYRRPIIEKFLSAGATFATFIHPSATMSPTSRIGNGVVIGPYVNLGPNVEVGDHTLINSRCSLGHDSCVGRYNFISPNVCFSGFTKVAEENLFGINSATIPGITIGNRNKIMAGMVLDKPVGDDEVVFFRFKEKIVAITK